MNAKQIVENLQNHKGQHVQACWTRPMKTRKDVPMSIVKRTCAYVRAGIDYANLRTVKEGVESGERNEVQGLKWGAWSEFPFIIAHKGVDYVRLYPAVFANLKPTVEYSIDGKPATRAEIEPYCLASEFRERDEETPCFTLKADSIVSIG
jgi:hypothetical protein